MTEKLTCKYKTVVICDLKQLQYIRQCIQTANVVSELALEELIENTPNYKRKFKLKNANVLYRKKFENICYQLGLDHQLSAAVRLFYAAAYGGIIDTSKSSLDAVNTFGWYPNVRMLDTETYIAHKTDISLPRGCDWAVRIPMPRYPNEQIMNVNCWIPMKTIVGKDMVPSNIRKVVIDPTDNWSISLFYK